MKNGRVIINRNICDNAADCSGILICPTEALHWNEAQNTIAYEENLCIDCGACADEDAGGCPIGAILWGSDDRDYAEKKKIVENDTRKLEELEVERYGAAPIENATIEIEDLKAFVKHSTQKYVAIEFFSDESINCLLHSIKVSEIKKLFPSTVIFQKICLNDISDCKFCTLQALPALAIYKDKVLQGVIDGYYNDSEKSKKEFFEQITALL